MELFRAVMPLGPVGSGVSNVWSINGLSPAPSEYTEWLCVDSVLALDGAGAAADVGAGTGVSTAGAGVEAAVDGAGIGVATGDEVGVGVATGDGVDVGPAGGAASAGESGTAVSEARVTTSAAISAVVFRIEFT